MEGCFFCHRKFTRRRKPVMVEFPDHVCNVCLPEFKTHSIKDHAPASKIASCVRCTLKGYKYRLVLVEQWVKYHLIEQALLN